MALNEIEILLKAILDTTSSKKIREQVKQIQKQLPAVEIKTKVEDKGLKNYSKSIDNLINKYKTKQISEEKYSKMLNNITQYHRFQNLEIGKQIKVYSELDRVQKKMESSANATQTTKNALRRKEIADMDRLHSQALRMNRDYDQRNSSMKMDDIHSQALRMNEKYDAAANARKIRDMDRLHSQALQMNRTYDRQRVSAERLGNQILQFQTKTQQKVDSLLAGPTKRFVDKTGLQQLSRDLQGLNTTNFKQKSQDISNRLSRISSEAANASRNSLKLGDAFKLATLKMVEWTVIGGLIFGTLRQIKEGVKYVLDLDNALNQIRIVTGQSVEDVSKLAIQYNKLGKAMSVSTTEIAKTSVELYRQGLSQQDVEKRMESIIKYAKIASIPLEDSNKIITATANATKRSVTDITDIFSLLGEQYCSAA